MRKVSKSLTVKKIYSLYEGNEEQIIKWAKQEEYYTAQFLTGRR